MSKKKTVIITGALSGIGEECARTFSQVGYNVVISGRNKQRGRELETELRQINTETHFFLADIVFENQVSELIKYTQQVFGTIDVLLNVAGTEGQPISHDKTTVEDFRHVFDTNVLGTQLE